MAQLTPRIATTVMACLTVWTQNVAVIPMAQSTSPKVHWLRGLQRASMRRTSLPFAVVVEIRRATAGRRRIVDRKGRKAPDRSDTIANRSSASDPARVAVSADGGGEEGGSERYRTSATQVVLRYQRYFSRGSWLYFEGNVGAHE